MFTLEPWHVWIIGGILLIILEMFTSTFFLASFGAAALATSIAAANDASTAWQLGVFAIVSSLMLILLRPVAVKGLYRRSDSQPTNAAAMIGRTGLVVDEIPGQLRPGRVKIGGEEWRSMSFDDNFIPENTVVTILEIDGATLTVRPAAS